jgi:hypothetical protein
MVEIEQFRRDYPPRKSFLSMVLNFILGKNPCKDACKKACLEKKLGMK